MSSRSLLLLESFEGMKEMASMPMGVMIFRETDEGPLESFDGVDSCNRRDADGNGQSIGSFIGGRVGLSR